MTAATNRHWWYASATSYTPLLMCRASPTLRALSWSRYNPASRVCVSTPSCTNEMGDLDNIAGGDTRAPLCHYFATKIVHIDTALARLAARDLPRGLLHASTH
ncbi:hypothetical protein Mapa_005674 [Marchantia paleacea]|nr:hypothetical protein Mapa_005674 [Marchantia paleacea]